jgi:hypothetical protein
MIAVTIPGHTPDEPSTSPAVSTPAEETGTTDMFAVVRTVLGRIPAQFTYAGELAALMAALPPDTPVRIAETVHIDPALELHATLNTTAAATIANLVDLVDAADVNGQIRRYGRVVPGVELGAYIIADGAVVPERTRPFPPHERAVDAIQHGDLAVVLDADIELLTWMAGMLTDPDPTGPIDTDTAPAWITDIDLREQLGIEAERLRQSAARLTTLRARIVEHQTAE